MKSSSMFVLDAEMCARNNTAHASECSVTYVEYDTLITRI